MAASKIAAQLYTVREFTQSPQDIAETMKKVSAIGYQEKHGDRTILDILYEDSDPGYFKAELDTYWIQHGGGSPVAWINKLSDRSPIIHFKDMMIVDGKQIFAEVGEGNLDWPGIIEACENAGTEWYIVEQDTCQRDPFESLEISFNNLKAMGVE